jgi:hypothetical protein
MAAFSRRFRWAFLTSSASFLFADFIGAVATADVHQSQQSEAQDRSTSAEARNFDAFLDAHPDIDAQLRTNPLLIKDQKWIQNHPEVLGYFDRNPQVKKEIAGSLSYFIRREGENVRKEEVATFQHFLSSNPKISEQLSANPLLVKEQTYLHEHPGLQAYLNGHPLVNKELREDPGLYLQRESWQNNPTQKGSERQSVQVQEKPMGSYAPRSEANRERVTHDQRQAVDAADIRGQTDQYGGRLNHTQTNPANGEIVSFDRFLDRHPEMSRELSSNPSLITNTQYLEQHRGLRAYLDEHPNVKKEVIETPNYFVRREVPTRYDALEVRQPKELGIDQMTGSPSSQRQTVNSIPVFAANEIVSFDKFLGEHKRINEDLEKEPARVNDARYLKKHTDLQDFLSQHVSLREELRQHPAYFMDRRNRHELLEAERTIEARSSDSANSGSLVTRLSQRDLRASDRFLEKHKNINKDLEKNPTLVADPHYLKKHKDFRQFLEQNPDVNAAMKKDPVWFMQSQHARFEQMHEKM